MDLPEIPQDSQIYSDISVLIHSKSPLNTLTEIETQIQPSDPAHQKDLKLSKKEV